MLDIVAVVVVHSGEDVESGHCHEVHSMHMCEAEEVQRQGPLSKCSGGTILVVLAKSWAAGDGKLQRPGV